jgi:NADPH-dependent ferric siderophore reductase
MNALPSASTHRLRVAGAVDVGPRMRRIMLVADAGLDGFDPLPGQDVVVHLSDGVGNGVRRRYTIRRLDRAASTFDLDVVVHGHGVGSAWGMAARVGDEVDVFGPRGKVLLSAAHWQLFVGDESALPAIVEMAEAVLGQAGDPARTVVALIEVQDAADEQPVGLTGGTEIASRLDLRWLHRGPNPPGAPDTLLAGLAGVGELNSGGHAYVFGESRVVRRLREELAAAGFRPDQISAKGYWNIGRASQD